MAGKYRPFELNGKTVMLAYEHTCEYPGCTTVFVAGLSKLNFPRKYCSRKCYHLHNVRKKYLTLA